MGLPRGQSTNPAPRTIGRQSSQCHSGRSPAPCATTSTGRGPSPRGVTTTAGPKPGTSISRSAGSSAGGGGSGAGSKPPSGGAMGASLRPTGAASGGRAHPSAKVASSRPSKSAPRGPQVGSGRRIVARVALIARQSLNTLGTRIKNRRTRPILKIIENLRELAIAAGDHRRSRAPARIGSTCARRAQRRRPRASRQAVRRRRARCGSPRGAPRCARAARRCRSRG